MLKKKKKTIKLASKLESNLWQEDAVLAKWPGEPSLGAGTLKPTLKDAAIVTNPGNRIPDGRNNKCKGPEVGAWHGPRKVAMPRIQVAARVQMKSLGTLAGVILCSI